jgi:hypothetical protein
MACRKAVSSHAPGSGEGAKRPRARCRGGRPRVLTRQDPRRPAPLLPAPPRAASAGGESQERFERRKSALTTSLTAQPAMVAGGPQSGRLVWVKPTSPTRPRQALPETPDSDGSSPEAANVQSKDSQGLSRRARSSMGYVDLVHFSERREGSPQRNGGNGRRTPTPERRTKMQKEKKGSSGRGTRRGASPVPELPPLEGEDLEAGESERQRFVRLMFGWVGLSACALMLRQPFRERAGVLLEKETEAKYWVDGGWRWDVFGLSRAAHTFSTLRPSAPR